MNPTFPNSHPGEIFYSTEARYFDYMDFHSNYFASLTLFDTFVSATVEFPKYLDKLAEKLPFNQHFDPNTIILDHTLFPYISPFISQEKINFLKEHMRKGKGKTLFLGLSPTHFELNQYLKYCPACIENDRIKFGEAYWHTLHQVPGVLICPEHLKMIQASNIPNRQNSPNTKRFITLENFVNNNSIYNQNSNSLSQAQFLFIAKEAQWLLEAKLEAFGKENLFNIYHHIFFSIGQANPSRITSQETIQRKFIEFYSEEFLQKIHCDIDENNSYNWFRRLLNNNHNKPITDPLKHILFAKFLGMSLKEIFEYQIESPFGTGPWSCLNPTCPDFNKNSIQEHEINFQTRTRPPIGSFSCPQCGFTYSISTLALGKKKIHANHIKDFGPVWKKSFKDMWNDKNLSLESISKQLNISTETLKKLAVKMNLDFPRYYKNRKVTKPVISNNFIKEKKYSKIETRKNWLDILADNPGIAMSQLRKENSGLTTWLDRHDKDWFNQTKPPLSRYKNKVDQSFWEKRDANLALKIPAACHELKISPGKPKMVTKSRIFEYLKILSISKYQGHLPKTVSEIEKHVETIEECLLRRIVWAKHEYINDKKIPTIAEFRKKISSWQFKKGSKIYTSQLDCIEEIKSELATNSQIKLNSSDEKL